MIEIFGHIVCRCLVLLSFSNVYLVAICQDVHYVTRQRHQGLLLCWEIVVILLYDDTKAPASMKSNRIHVCNNEIKEIEIIKKNRAIKCLII